MNIVPTIAVLKLSNQHKYTLNRLTGFLFGSVAGFFSCFLPRFNRIIITSSHNKHFNFNSKALFLHLLQNHSQVKFSYIINDTPYRQKLIHEHGPYFISNRSPTSLWKILTAKTWVTSTMETPVLGLFNGFRREIIHLNHGTYFKAVGLGENKVSTLKKLYYYINTKKFDRFYVTTELLREKIAHSFHTKTKKIFVNGNLRNDSLQHSPSEKIERILYAPTWRKNSDSFLNTIDWGQLKQFLRSNNLHLFIRTHPFFEEQIDETSGLIENLNAEKCPEIIDQMHTFDILITDYSSIFIDYLLLDRPILFIKYQHELFLRNHGFVLDYDKFTPGFKAKNQSGLESAIEQIIKDGDPFEFERKSVKNLLHHYQDQKSCERLMNSLS